MNVQSVEKAADRLVEAVLSEGGMNPYNPLVGSMSAREKSENVKKASELDKQLARDRDFQDFIGDIFADYGVDNFTDLEKTEPQAIVDIIRRGNEILRQTTEKSPADKFPIRNGANLRPSIADQH